MIIADSDSAPFQALDKNSPVKPNGYRWQFGCGPCVKPEGYRLENLSDFHMGLSHRMGICIEEIFHIIQGLKKLLCIPEEYRVALVPGSASGAIEMAMWNLLTDVGIGEESNGAIYGNCADRETSPDQKRKGVDIIVADVFSQLWAHSSIHHLKLPTRLGVIGDDCFHSRFSSGFATNGAATVTFLDSAQEAKQWSCNENPLVFAWTGTSHGISLGSWIKAMGARKGLVLCDAAAGVLSENLPWEALDATCFSWQKGLGGEADFGVIVLSPKAYAHLTTAPMPLWPVPRVFRLRNSDGSVTDGVFQGLVLNTPSMLLMREASYLLELWEKKGALHGASQTVAENAAVIQSYCGCESVLTYLVKDPQLRAGGPTCLVPSNQEFFKSSKEDQWRFIKAIAATMAKSGIASEIGGHPSGLPCFRIWSGPTIRAQDLQFCMHNLKACVTAALASS